MNQSLEEILQEIGQHYYTVHFNVDKNHIAWSIFGRDAYKNVTLWSNTIWIYDTQHMMEDAKNDLYAQFMRLPRDGKH